MTLMMENLHFAKGIDPVADVFDNAAAPASDVYSMRGHGRGLFVIYIGVGATGTQTMTVEACDDVVPTTTTAIPFWYRQILSGDTPSAITRATAAGFTITAGSSKIVLLEVDAKDLAASGYGFVRMKQSAEPVNSPVLGGVMFIAGGNPNRYAGQVGATVIA